jgi:Xaa-Pro aminopeptidase
MSYGKLQVDWEERINIQRMREERLQKARAKAAHHGFKSLLLLHGDNMRYVGAGDGVHLFMGVSGYRYVLFPVDEDPIVFEVGMRQGFTKKACPCVDVRHSIPVMSYLSSNAPEGVYENQLRKFANQIKAELGSRGLAKEVLGIDAHDHSLVKALHEVGIETSTNGGKAMLEARRQKTKDEVECLRMIASIVESILWRFKRTIRPGVTEAQLRGIATHMAYLEGADWASAPDINSGPHTWPLAVQCSDRAIRPGELVAAALCNLSYNGYKSCYYRTFSCGRPTTAQKDAYAKTLDLVYNAIRAIKPGATTKDLAEKWPKPEDFGWPAEEDSACLMQWGHGIGLGLYESPLVSRIWSLDYPDRLEPGMTFALETVWPTGEKSHAYPDGQATRIEEMIHFTETGVEIISKWPVDEITVCEL